MEGKGRDVFVTPNSICQVLHFPECVRLFKKITKKFKIKRIQNNIKLMCNINKNQGLKMSIALK